MKIEKVTGGWIKLRTEENHWPILHITRSDVEKGEMSGTCGMHGNI